MKHVQSKRYLFKDILKKRPINMMDIGIMGGIEPEWKPFSDFISIIGLEPDIRVLPKFNHKNKLSLYSYFVWSSTQELTFYITKDPGKSSAYQPNQKLLSEFPHADRFEIIETKIIPKSQVKTLDDIQKQTLKNNYDLDFLKLDTQGSEYDILKGGISLLPSICAAQIEVEFLPLYINQPLFSELNTFFIENGFILMDLKRYFWKRKTFVQYPGKGQLIFADALYFQTPSFYLKNNLDLPRHDFILKILKYVCIALIYDLPDLAIMILEESRQYHFLPHDLFTNILKKITTLYQWRRRLSHMSLMKIQGLLQRLSFFIQDPTQWASSDHFLGNRSDWR